MLWQVVLIVAVLSVLCSNERTVAASDDQVQLYLDVQHVNKTESLRRLSELPIVYYKFLHDTVPDRVQLGAIGPEAQRLFPDSIEVLPAATFTNMSALATGGRISTYSVRNFPIVDKNVLFMHGLAALQELISRYETLQSLISTLSERDQSVYGEIRKAQDVLERAIDKQLASKLEALELESKNLEAQLSLEADREAEESRKQQQKLGSEQALLEYEEQLARERMQQQEQSVRETVAQQLNLEKELALRREALHRENELKLGSLKESQRQQLEAKRLEYEKEKIRAEIEARSQQERLNEEIQIKKIQLQSKLETERMVQGIKNVSQQLSSMIQRVFAHPEQLLLISGMFLGIILCYYLIKEFSSLVRQFIQQRLGRPVLVRETSYQWSFFPSWLKALLLWGSKATMSKEAFMRSWSSPQAMQQLADQFSDIILSAEDKERILQLALATRNTKRSSAPYRHVLLHGPPGTGKTLVARRLAACSDMDYAILSGGDVAPLGEDAVNQLHALFSWAQKSERGLLVFIDEAEAFLCSRTGSSSASSMVNADEGTAAVGNSGAVSITQQSTHLRNALNALLYQTGTPSRSFMMVLATNRPQDLDAAVLDRVDVSLQIGLPQPSERRALIHLYMQIHVTEAVRKAMESSISIVWKRLSYLFGKRPARVVSSNSTLPPEIYSFVDEECLSESSMHEMLQLTQGFSGREISKLFISVQYVLLLSPERKLTWPMLRETVVCKAEEHRMKMAGFTAVPSVVALKADKKVLRKPSSQSVEEEMHVDAGVVNESEDESVTFKGSSNRRTSSRTSTAGQTKTAGRKSLASSATSKQ